MDVSFQPFTDRQEASKTRLVGELDGGGLGREVKGDASISRNQSYLTPEPFNGDGKGVGILLRRRKRVAILLRVSGIRSADLRRAVPNRFPTRCPLTCTPTIRSRSPSASRTNSRMSLPPCPHGPGA